MSVTKERPILFSGPMVRAILEGRKTVTRRAIKPQPSVDQFGYMRWQHKGVLVTEQNTAWAPFDKGFPAAIADGLLWLCPYGKPGDRLWVRETWSVEMLSGYSEEGGYSSEYELRYRADDSEREISIAAGEPDPWLHLYDSQRGEWRPSIHMPRTACRILLEITDVRVERLQDISRADIRAEGLKCPQNLASDDVSPNYRDWYPAAWRELWESTGGDWDGNPWVWVVDFKRIEQ